MGVDIIAWLSLTAQCALPTLFVYSLQSGAQLFTTGASYTLKNRNIYVRPELKACAPWVIVSTRRGCVNVLVCLAYCMFQDVSRCSKRWGREILHERTVLVRFFQSVRIVPGFPQMNALCGWERTIPLATRGGVGLLSWKTVLLPSRLDESRKHRSSDNNTNRWMNSRCAQNITVYASFFKIYTTDRPADKLFMSKRLGRNRRFYREFQDFYPNCLRLFCYANCC